MPKLGSVLGATRGGNKDAVTPGRGGRSRGQGTTGFRGQSTRGAARGRGRGQTQAGRSTPIDTGAQNGNESLTGITASNSPFAAIKNDNFTGFGSAPSFDASQSSTVFGRPSPNPGSIASNGFGTPSITHQPMGNSIQPGRDPRPKATSQKRPPKEPLIEPNSAGGTTIGDYQDRYDKLKADRIKQREKAIKQGQMADPNQPTLLNKAITPVGTCTTMCPEFERVERIVQKMVDKSEKTFDPTTGSFEVRELKMLKRFRRSAAGYDEQLPSDIRTPNALLQTVNYLIRHVVSGPDPLGLIHKFVWDRTRSIRNDFSVQQLTKVEDIKIAVKCLERIARFHIISLHLLSSPENEEQFDHHQEREQLNNTMLSLMHYYDDNRDRMDFPNEPEFRAYYIVLAIHDQRPDIEDRVQKWPEDILQNSKVQIALELLAAANNYWEYQMVLDGTRPNAISQGFYDRFFNLVDSPSVSYLMGCVAEIYFNNVRQTAIRTIWKAYCRVPISQQHKNEDWTLDELTSALYFDDESQAEEFCEEQGLQLMEKADGSLYLNWGTSSIDTVDFAPSSRHSFSDRYVEVKRGGRTLAAIILGLNIEQAATRGMIDGSLLPTSFGTPIDEDDDELFVNQHGQSPEREETLFPGSSESVTTSTNGQAVAPFVATNPFGLSQPSSAPVGVSPNPFASITPSTDATAKSPFTSKPLFSTPTTTPAPTSSWSTFTQTPASTAPISQGIVSANTSQPLFSWAAPTQSTSEELAALTTTAPVGPPKPSFSWTSTSQNSSTTFKPAEPLATAEKSNLPPLTAPTLFFPPESNQENIPSSHVAGETTKPLFSWTPEPQVPSTIFKTPDLLEAANDPRPPFKFSPPSSLQPPSHEIPALNVSDTAPQSIFSKLPPPQTSPVTFEAPTPAVTTSNGLFSGQAVQESPSVDSETNDGGPETRVTSQSLFQPSLSTEIATNLNQELANEQSVNEQSVVELEQDQAVVEAFHANSPPPSTERSVDSSADFRKSWIETLKQSAMSNRTSHANRKRPLEDEKEELLKTSEKKPATTDKPRARNGKVAKSKPKLPAPRKQKKTSLALASIAPLPTLPILEKVKKLTEAKRPLEDETVSSRSSQIDEDEILLSAARIAAEQLKSGPRLIERASDYSNTDLFRSSFSSSSLGRSLGSESRLSASLSSSSPYARINGYDLALAPETPLGLGRTLSRTEQRLRLTGGRGLAYKPLQLTPEKETSIKSSGKRKHDCSSDS